MKTIKIALLVTIGLVLSACGDRLVFVTKTSVGVDMGINGADNGIHIGFKRFEGVIDPLKGCADQDCTKGKKAQSLLAKLNFGLSQEKQNDSVYSDLAQWIATGEAATILARRENTVLALTGKDLKLATSFTQGLNLKRLVLYADIQNKLIKYPKMKNISTEIDTVSKSIFYKLFNECKLNLDKNKEFAKTFSALVHEYDNCNNKKENCKLKDNVSVTELSKEIDDKLNSLLVIMIGQLTNILTKEQKL